jgi:hypothetical protein
MEFQKSDLELAYRAIGAKLIEISSSHNDGWTASTCKHDLYLLKCWLEDRYNQLPIFVGESEWEQERLINILKKD